MESGHVRRPQAARSTGRPQYHGGRRGMRDEENEERTRGGGEDSNSVTEEEKRTKTKMGWERCKDNGKIRGTKEVPMLCFCVFNLWVVSKLGTMNRGDRVLGGGERRSGCSSKRVAEGRGGQRNNWSWGVQSVGKS